MTRHCAPVAMLAATAIFLSSCNSNDSVTERFLCDAEPEAGCMCNSFAAYALETEAASVFLPCTSVVHSVGIYKSGVLRVDVLEDGAPVTLVSARMAFAVGDDDWCYEETVGDDPEFPLFAYQQPGPSAPWNIAEAPATYGPGETFYVGPLRSSHPQEFHSSCLDDGNLVEGIEKGSLRLGFSADIVLRVDGELVVVGVSGAGWITFAGYSDDPDCGEP